MWLASARRLPALQGREQPDNMKAIVLRLPIGADSRIAQADMALF